MNAKDLDKKRNIKELPDRNRKRTDWKYKRATAEPYLTGDSFPGGEHTYNFSVGLDEGTRLDKAFVLYNIKVTAADGTTQLTSESGMAPSMGGAANMFNKASFMQNDIVLDNVPKRYDRICAVSKRLRKGRALIESLYSDAEFWEASFHKRKNIIISDGQEEDETIRYEFLDMGFVAGTSQVTWTQIGSVLTFSGGTVPTMTNFVRPGDKVKLTTAANSVAGIVDTVGAAFITLGSIPIGQADIPAANLESFTVWSKKASERTKDLQYVHFPTLGPFMSNKVWYKGKYRLDMTAKSTEQLTYSMIESIVAKTTANVKVSVVSHHLYVPKFKIKRPADGILYKSIKCYASQDVPISTNSQTDYPFTVKKSIQEITVGVQDAAAGLSTSGQTCLWSPSKFKVRSGVDLNIDSLQIELGTITRPSPQDAQFIKSTATGIDRLKKYWLDTYMNAGALYDAGGWEKFQEWQDRGPLYHWKLYRTIDEKNITNLTVRLGFSALSGTTPKLFLFQSYEKIVKTTMKDGQIVSVEVQEV
jgi:hypothetical protein